MGIKQREILKKYFIQTKEHNGEECFRIALVVAIDSQGNRLFEGIGYHYSNYWDASRDLVALVESEVLKVNQAA
jgi:hypothetical protein